MQAAASGVYTFSEKEFTAATGLARKAINLGIVGKTDELRNTWDGTYPEEMPYDPQGSDGKHYDTVDTLLAGSKGMASIASISKNVPRVGAAILEALVRVISYMPAGVERSADPLGVLATLLAKSPEQFGVHLSNSDKEIVQMVVNLRIIRQGHKLQRGDAGDRYGSYDMDVQKFFVKTPAAGRLENWGNLISQTFVDFMRHLGEQAALMNWEKKTTFSEHNIRYFIRNVTYITGTPLAYDTLGMIWDRVEA